MASLKSQAASLFLSRIIAYVLMALAPIILTRIMSTTEFGVYQQILFVLTFIAPLIALRIPQSLFYFFPRKIVQHSMLYSQTVTILVFSSFSGTILIFICGYFFNLLPSGIEGNYLVPVALCVFAEAIATLFDIIFILEKNPKLILVSNIGSGLFRLFLIILSYQYFNTIFSVINALLIYSIMRFFIAFVFLVKKYSVRISSFDYSLLKEQLVYILPLAMSQIVFAIGSKVDKIVVSKLFSPEDFAIYALGSLSILRAITMIYGSIGQVCLTKFSELAVENKLNDILQLWHKQIIMQAVITVPVVFFCFTYADELITILYTEKYSSAANVWRITMFALLFQMIGHGHIPTALGYTRSILIANAVRFIVSIPLSYYLVVNFGLEGGAISFVAGLAVESFFQLIQTKKILKIKFVNFFPWIKLIIIFVCPIFILVFLKLLVFLKFSILSNFLISCLIFFPIVTCLFLNLKIVEYSEMKKLISFHNK